MLRLALLATAIAYANAATSGSGVTLFQIKDDNSTNDDTFTDNTIACFEGGFSQPTGTTATTGPRFAAATVTDKGVAGSKVFIEGECNNNTNAGGWVNMGTLGAAGVQDGLLGPADAAILSFKFVKGDGTTAGGTETDVPYMLTYDDADCATLSAGSPAAPIKGANATAGDYMCSNAAGGLSLGFLNSDDGATSDNAATVFAWNTINYVKATNYDDAQASAPDAETCATAETDNDGTEKFYMHVAADDNVAHGTAATIESSTDANGEWGLRNAAACYVGHEGNAGWGGTASSYNAMCELETGDLVFEDFNTDNCIGSADVTLRFNANDYGTADISCTKQANNNNWGIASADVAAVCASPASTSTAKWFTGYLVGSSGTCATHTGATVAQNDGSRAVILGVCYTNAHADGEMTGWTGPFSDGAAGTEPIAVSARTAIGTTGSGGSYKFTDVSGVITLTPYTTPDCSGTAGTAHADDPAGGGANDWPCNGSTLLSHGAVGASGNGAAQLQTASYYLTVRSHGDATTNGNKNMGGMCYGQSVPASGERVDHFILDQCFQKSATTSYKWKCESSGTTFTNGTTEYYAISYDEYTDTACTTAAAAGPYKYFTQTSFSACALTADGTICTAATSDTAAEFALNTLGCGACSTTTVDTEAACLALSTPGTWTAGDGVTTTTTGRTAGANDTTCTSTHASQTEWGGRCIQNGAAQGAGTTDNSWEILTDDATWAAMCGPATPSPSTTTTTTTSGAGKIAATAAAAAAAAAILL